VLVAVAVVAFVVGGCGCGCDCGGGWWVVVVGGYGARFSVQETGETGKLQQVLGRKMKEICKHDPTWLIDHHYFHSLSGSCGEAFILKQLLEHLPSKQADSTPVTVHGGNFNITCVKKCIKTKLKLSILCLLLVVVVVCVGVGGVLSFLPKFAAVLKTMSKSNIWMLGDANVKNAFNAVIAQNNAIMNQAELPFASKHGALLTGFLEEAQHWCCATDSKAPYMLSGRLCQHAR